MNLRQFKALMMHPPLRNLILTGMLTCVVLGGVFFIQLSFDGFTILAWQIFVVDFACLLVLVGGSLGYVLSLYHQTLRWLSEARMQQEEDDHTHPSFPHETENVCEHRGKEGKRISSLRLSRGRTATGRKQRYTCLSSHSHL